MGQISARLRQLCTACSPFPMKLEIATVAYSSLAFLYTVRDSVYLISARLRRLCTACSPFPKELEIATAVYSSLAFISQYSLRLGQSDQREMCLLCTAQRCGSK